MRNQDRRKIKIGDTSSALSSIEARWREIKSVVDGGSDWYAEQEKQRLKDQHAREEACTFSDLAADDLERHAKTRKRTGRDDFAKLNRYVLPIKQIRESSFDIRASGRPNVERLKDNPVHGCCCISRA